MKKVICTITLLLSVFFAQAGLDPVPELTGRVVDKTATLTVYEIQELEQKLQLLEDSMGSQIVVVLVPTTGDESIEEFSMRLAEEWQIGREGADNGIILLIAKDDRELRIEVGYGFEGALPDALAARIIDELITPEFKNGDFAAGINAGTDALIQIAYGEEFVLPPRDDSSGSTFGKIAALLIFITIAVFFVILIAKFKFKAILIMAGFAFLSVLLIIGWEAALGALFMVFVFGIIVLGFFTGGSSSGYSSGSSFSSSSSSWSSSGGSSFSGGGGSFGGGGASGSW